MKALIDLFNTFEALGDKTVFVNRTGMCRLVVSYGKLTVTFEELLRFHYEEPAEIAKMTRQAVENF